RGPDASTGEGRACRRGGLPKVRCAQRTARGGAIVATARKAARSQGDGPRRGRRSRAGGRRGVAAGGAAVRARNSEASVSETERPFVLFSSVKRTARIVASFGQLLLAAGFRRPGPDRPEGRTAAPSRRALVALRARSNAPASPNS